MGRKKGKFKSFSYKTRLKGKFLKMGLKRPSVPHFS